MRLLIILFFACSEFHFQTPRFKGPSSFFYSESSSAEDFCNKLTIFHPPLNFPWCRLTRFLSLNSSILIILEGHKEVLSFFFLQYWFLIVWKY